VLRRRGLNGLAWLHRPTGRLPARSPGATLDLERLRLEGFELDVRATTNAVAPILAVAPSRDNRANIANLGQVACPDRQVCAPLCVISCVCDGADAILRSWP
jgi:hypothetical protein